MILDQSVKLGPGCIKYDLEGFQHPQYSAGITAFHIEFSEEDTDASFGMESVFSGDLYACVTPENLGLKGMAQIFVK
jgi:hypothetical protein